MKQTRTSKYNMRIYKLSTWTSQLALAKLVTQANSGARERDREREACMVWWDSEHIIALVQHI